MINNWDNFEKNWDNFEKNSNKLTSATLALSLCLSWCNVTMIKSDDYPSNNNLRHTTNSQNLQRTNSYGIEQEIQNAERQLRRTNNFEEKIKILEYIRRLRNTTQRPNWSDRHITYEQREVMPNQVFIQILWWEHKYTRLGWKLLEPWSWKTKDETLSLYNRNLSTNVNINSSSTWTLVFQDWRRSKSVNISFEYDWNYLRINQDWQQSQIPILNRNKWRQITVRLHDRNYDNWGTVLKLIVDWR